MGDYVLMSTEDTRYRNMSSGQHSVNIPARDPFYVVKEKVQGLITKVSIDFDKWKDIFENSNTARNTDFIDLGKGVRVAIASINVDLNDLAQTIKIVEQNRTRFKDIDDNELNSRRKFVNDMKVKIQNIEETLNSQRTKKKLEKDERESLMGSSNGRRTTSGMERERKQDAGDYIDDRRNQTQALVGKQDEVLDDMSSALGRLTDVAATINTELKDQNQILQSMDGEMDESLSSMGMVMGKLNRIIGKSDKGRLCCIIFLIITALVELLLIIYT